MGLSVKCPTIPQLIIFSDGQCRPPRAGQVSLVLQKEQWGEHWGPVYHEIPMQPETFPLATPLIYLKSSILQMWVEKISSTTLTLALTLGESRSLLGAEWGEERRHSLAGKACEYPSTHWGSVWERMARPITGVGFLCLNKRGLRSCKE